MLCWYYVGLAVIWGLAAVLIVPLGEFAAEELLLPPIASTAVAAVIILLAAGLLHRLWYRRWADKLPKAVGPQHGSM